MARYPLYSQQIYTEHFAFPLHLRDQVNVVLKVITREQNHLNLGSIIVNVNNEELFIPQRVYYNEKALSHYLNKEDELSKITACLGTRHHNGFVREACLKQIILCEEEWITPFIVLMLGDYVIEILKLLESQLSYLKPNIFSLFLQNNKQLFQQLKGRMGSYWNEYHRDQYYSWKKYSGYIVIKKFDQFLKQKKLKSKI